MNIFACFLTVYEIYYPQGNCSNRQMFPGFVFHPAIYVLIVYNQMTFKCNSIETESTLLQWEFKWKRVYFFYREITDFLFNCWQATLFYW